MRDRDRMRIRSIVHGSPSVDFVVVHHVDGSNDYFSHIPDVEVCQRSRVAAVLRSIAAHLEAGKPQSTGMCPGAHPGRPC